MKKMNAEIFSLESIKKIIHYGGFSVLPRGMLLPLIKELDIVNPKWMDGVKIQELNIKINVKDLIYASNNATVIINFLISGLEIDNESIKYFIDNNLNFIYNTEFQKNLEVKKI